MAGMCLDITLPSLLSASSFQLVEVASLLARPSTPNETKVEPLGTQRKRVRAREQIITSWGRQRDGGSSSHLEKANNILGSRRWQASLKTRSHMEKGKHVRCVQKKAEYLVGDLRTSAKGPSETWRRLPKLASPHLQHSSMERFCLCPTELLPCRTTPNQCFKSVLK